MEKTVKKAITREKVSFVLKILTVINSFVGIILSFVFARQEGYSTWYIRGAYFTLQSNLWISGLMLYTLIAPFLKNKLSDKVAYFLKFIFTVSITITFIVFWTLLAPFAYMDNYNPWSISSLTTHMFAPSFAIADFFVDKKQTHIAKKHVFSALLPPLVYFLFSCLLMLFRIDFGRGDFYPYFFMDIYSPAGWFGLVKEPFVLGTAYWLALIFVIVLSVGALLRWAHSLMLKKS